MNGEAEQNPNKESASISERQARETPLRNGNPKHELTPEDASRGGKKSAENKKKEKARNERLLYLFKMAVKDPDIKKKLEELGIDPEDMDYKTAMDASMIKKVIDKGDPIAYKAINEEAYGPQKQQNELEISGEISGININVKSYDKKGGAGDKTS